MFVLSVASPRPRNPKVPRQGGLPACPAGLATHGHQALIKSSHAFFRGHPECQRSRRTQRFAAVRGAGEGSERSDLVKLSLNISSTKLRGCFRDRI
jgi:hypothetical protein